jgi:Ser/Thr protein kinase RdoA (MazF antagonist)
MLVQDLVNTTFRGTAAGVRWGVRVHGPRGAAGRALAAAEVEAAWLEALGRDTRLPLPAPRRTRDGRAAVLATAPGIAGPRVVSLRRWVPGRPAARTRRGAGYYAAVGRVAATLHRHARGWAPPAGAPRSPLASAALGAPHAAGGAWGRLPPAVRRDLRTAVRRLRDAEARLGTGTDAYGLVHSDLSVGNVLRTPAGTLAPIDFGDGGLGHFAADAAVPLAGAVGFGAAGDRRRRAAFLRGYREVAPFPPTWAALLPVFMAGRAVAVALWAAGQPAESAARDWIGGNGSGSGSCSNGDRVRTRVPSGLDFGDYRQRVIWEPRGCCGLYPRRGDTLIWSTGGVHPLAAVGGGGGSLPRVCHWRRA